jgi:Mn2+/Fe2+ NRAMP family transporter
MSLNPGHLPEWGRAEIPAPPPFSLKNAWKLVGPATIAVGVSIGSGEWLLGPAVTVKYGAALLWVATVSILTQTILNQEMIRYTLATGEPIFTGIMRTWPGPWFWGPIYSVLLFLQVGWPSWALLAATTIAAAFKGSLTTDADKQTIIMWGYFTFVVSVLIVALGKKIEKTLEYVEGLMVIWILIFLLIVGVFFTSLPTWGKIWGGFLGLGGAPIPTGGDWVLLSSFAAYAGMGGLANAVITNWVRDRGWGMASTVGYIPALVGRRKVNLSQVGNTFPLTPEYVNRFQLWMKYTKFEQYAVFAVGCFLGVALPAIMTVHFVPPGTDISKGWGGAAYQAAGIASVFGSVAWFLTLLNGFWIMFSTQLGLIDMFARTVTDISWSASPRLRDLASGDVRKIYYVLLVIHALFGMWAINQAQPFTLLIIGGFITGFNFVVLGIHTIVVHKRFLPAQLRMPVWRLCVLLIMIAMFAFFTYLSIRSNWSSIVKLVGGA